MGVVFGKPLVAFPPLWVVVLCVCFPFSPLAAPAHPPPLTFAFRRELWGAVVRCAPAEPLAA